MAARTIMPVLPQEDPGALEERTQEYIRDIQPRNAIERDLVCQAARLSYVIDLAERVETAHLAGRVREATQAKQVSAQELAKVLELGRRLLYIVGFEAKYYPNAPWDDEPALFVRGLEETAEGCRWLLERFAEYRNMLEQNCWWGMAPLVRFIRLLGKRIGEATYDPAVNLVFVAWETLAPKAVEAFWMTYQDTPPRDPRSRIPAPDEVVRHRPPTQKKKEAWAILNKVVDQHVARLKKLLAEHEAVTAEEAADRAAFDCSKELERHRRYQSARTRELHRALDQLRKLRKVEFGMGNEECRMAEGKCQLADDTSQMNVGQDSNLVTADSANDKIGMSSHEQTAAADRACQETSVKACPASESKTPETGRSKPI